MQHKRILLGGTSLLALGLLMTPALAQEQLETVVVTGIRASLQSAQNIKQNADQVVDSVTAVDIGALPDNSVAEALQRIPGIQITRTDQVNDPLRWAGFGNGVFIRGLSWVKSLTNGEEIFGASDGRSISFADISSDLMAGVDVYKNAGAKMIEGGVGGTIDLKTRKPFDAEGRVVAVSGNLNMGTLSYHATPAINALYSDRFNTRIGEIGILLSADYQDLMSSNNVVSTDPWNNTGTVDGQTTYYPKGTTNTYGMIGYRHMDWKQPRVALDATVQWRPTASLEVTLTSIFSKAEPQSNEHNVAWIVPARSSSSANYMPYASTDSTAISNSVGSYTYDSNGYWTGGTIYNAVSNSTTANYFDTRAEARHHINKNVELNIKYNPTDNLQISIDGNYVDSRATMSSMTLYNMVKNSGYRSWSSLSAGGKFFPSANPVDVTVDITGSSPSISYNSTGTSVLADQSNYLWAAAMDHYENNYAHAYVARADATYTFDGEGLLGWLKSADIGFRSNLKQAITRNSGWNWGRIGFETWSYGGCTNGNTSTAASATAAALAACAAGIPTFTNVGSTNTAFYKFPDVFGTKMPGVWEPTMGWLRNPYAVWDSVQDVEAMSTSVGRSSSLWTPFIRKNGANCSGTVYKCSSIYNGVAGSSSTSGVSNQKEDTYAGYLQANYAHAFDLWGYDLPIDGNIGVRLVKTQYNSGEGYLKLPTVYSCTATNCTDRTEAQTFVGQNSDGSYGGTNVQYDAVEHNYTNVLPSFNLRAQLAERLQVRLAYSQGMVRPDLDKLRNYTSLGYAWATSSDGTDQTGTFASSNALTGSGSNPNLKPMYSQNYDVSLEWYFSQTGHVSFAMFTKTISNYIMSGNAYMTFERNGVSEKFNVATYVNGDRGKVSGFEFDYQQFFDGLPGAFSGLGASANYTKIYNSGGHNSISAGNYSTATAITYSNSSGLPMEGMSNDSANLALMYEKYGLSARVAYNWRSSFLVSSYATNLNEPVWQRNYGQVDTSFLYTFLDHYKAGIQVNNLFKQTTVLEIGDSASDKHAFEWVEGERKLSLVFRANW
ncbi:MAG: TonB-dependent receptor [Rhizomicrobium sp.]